MKIWPFDTAAELSDGLHISGPELRKGLEPFEKIRNAVGDRIDIMVELHSLWNLPTAKRIAQALEPLRSVLVRRSRSRWTTCRRLRNSRVDPRAGHRQRDAGDALGVSRSAGAAGGRHRHARPELGRRHLRGEEDRHMAEAHQLPIAPHDCTGPVVLIASLHLSLNAPNALIQETVRAFLSTWYRDLVTELPRIKAGFAYPMTAPASARGCSPISCAGRMSLFRFRG